jgi:hypothetical protein
MNRRDVSALGWVVTRDAISEIVSVLLGRPRRISPEALKELSERWRAILVSPAPYQATPLRAFFVRYFTATLSTEREKAIVEFVNFAQTCRPDLYSERALVDRYRSGWRQAIVTLALAAILSSWASDEILIVQDAAFVLLTMACWSLLTAIQLWRMYRLVERVGRLRRPFGSVDQRSATRRADSESPDP